MYEPISLDIPNSDGELRAGYRVRLGRFDETTWVVSYGWYSWGGNRPVCGWYLVDLDDPGKLKPLQLTDLDDLIFVEM